MASGTGKTFLDSGRLAKDCGGRAGGWAKMPSSFTVPLMGSALDNPVDDRSSLMSRRGNQKENEKNIVRLHPSNLDKLFHSI
jgi:hypothetical protein